MVTTNGWSLEGHSYKTTILTHTLHRVAIINFNMWSLPRISSLHKISIWKYKQSSLTTCTQ